MIARTILRWAPKCICKTELFEIHHWHPKRIRTNSKLTARKWNWTWELLKPWRLKTPLCNKHWLNSSVSNGLHQTKHGCRLFVATTNKERSKWASTKTAVGIKPTLPLNDKRFRAWTIQPTSLRFCRWTSNTAQSGIQTERNLWSQHS